MLFSSEVHSLVKISFGAQRGAGGAYSLVFVLYHKNTTKNKWYYDDMQIKRQMLRKRFVIILVL